MNKDQTVAALAADLDIEPRVAEQIMAAFGQVAEEILEKGQPFRLRAFGTFELQDETKAKANAFRMGESHSAQACKRLILRPGKELHRLIKDAKPAIIEHFEWPKGRTQTHARKSIPSFARPPCPTLFDAWNARPTEADPWTELPFGRTTPPATPSKPKEPNNVPSEPSKKELFATTVQDVTLAGSTTPVPRAMPVSEVEEHPSVQARVANETCLPERERAVPPPKTDDDIPDLLADMMEGSVNQEQLQTLEKIASGRQCLLACLQFMKNEGESFEPDDWNALSNRVWDHCKLPGSKFLLRTAKGSGAGQIEGRRS